MVSWVYEYIISQEIILHKRYISMASLPIGSLLIIINSESFPWNDLGNVVYGVYNAHMLPEFSIPGKHCMVYLFSFKKSFSW
jgi:hypothetical protein